MHLGLPFQSAVVQGANVIVVDSEDSCYMFGFSCKDNSINAYSPTVYFHFFTDTASSKIATFQTMRQCTFQHVKSSSTTCY